MATPSSSASRKRAVPKPKPEDVGIAKVLELGGRAAAEAKAKKVAPRLTLAKGTPDEVTFELPVDLRLDTVRGIFKLIDGDFAGMDTMLRDLLGEEALEHPAVRALTIEDLGALFSFVDEAYGVGLGNSEASTPS